MHVVAHRPTQTSVTLWIQTEQSETGWSLDVVGPGAAIAPIRESTAEAHPLPNMLPGQRDFLVRTHTLTDLAPGTDYTVLVSAPFAGEQKVAATFRTLPTALSAPFTLLLASCYSEDSDLALPVGGGPLGDAWRLLTRRVRRAAVTTRSAARREVVGTAPRANVSRRYQLLDAVPDLKVFCGDQVYPDTPLTPPMSASSIRRRISRTYSRSWDKLGFMLSHGGNVCASDDHEYWNDFPARPSLLSNLVGLHDDRMRQEWEATARQFVEHVQLAQPVVSFDIGADLSFFVADTRINRDHPDRDDPSDGPPRFMREPDFTRLISWIDGLTAPGVLVLGQPVLAKANRRDRCLPDFPNQYDRLCRALAVAPRDVVVLAGDVHFGRAAEIAYPRPGGAEGRVYEVISSPMALVSLWHGLVPLAAGRYLSDMTELASPGDPVHTGRVRYAVPVESSGIRCEDHFMTLRFTKLPAGGGIEVEVLAHLLRRPAGNQPARVQPIDRFTLRTPDAAAATGTS